MFVDPIKPPRSQRKRRKSEFLRRKTFRILLSILPGIFVAAFVFSANVYYDLDQGTGTVVIQNDANLSNTTASHLTVSDLAASRLIASDANKALVSTDLSSWISGTTNQITVTDNGDGTITLSTPQDIHTSATPTFSDLTLTSLTQDGVVLSVSGNLNSQSILDVSHGGTGTNSLTQYGILYGNGTGAIGATTAGTTNQVLVSGGGTSAPDWSNITNLLTAGTNISISGTTNATIATVNNPVFSTSVTTPLLLTSSGAITIETGASAGADDIVFKPAEEEKLRIKENGDLFFEEGTYDTTLTITTPTANRTITFPDASGTVAVSATAPITLSSEGTIGLTTPLATTYGGTGLSSIGTANQILGVNSDASGLEYKTLQGTTNQITVSHSQGAITLSLPQDIATSSSPTFSGLTLSSLTEGSILFTGSSGVISEDNSNLYWDDTNNRLGIGTASPGAKLHVSGGNIYLDNTFGVYIKDNSGTAQSMLRLNASNEAVLGYENANGLYVKTGGNLYLYGGGSEQVRITSSGNVGIGTTSPGAKLHVSGGDILLDNDQYIKWKNAAGAATNIFRLDSTDGLELGNDAIGSVYHKAGGSMYFRTGGSGWAMFISNTGNVGIGTTEPRAKTDIVDTSNTPDDVNDGVGGHLRLSLGSAVTDESLFFGVNSGGYSWIQAIDPGNVYRDLSLNPKGGNVGIGTTSPGYKLDVSGSIRATGHIYVGSHDSIIKTDSTNYFSIWANPDYTKGAFLGMRSDDTATDYAFQFKWNNDVKVTIDTNGNVGIGTTDPGKKLEVSGDIKLSDGADRAIHGPASGWLRLYVQGNEAFAHSWNDLYQKAGGRMHFVTNDSERMTIDSSGNVGIGTTDPGSYRLYLSGGEAYCDQTTCWNDASDIALKENIRDLDYGLKEILALKPTRFLFKPTGEEGIGFVAQEVEKIIPEVVSGEEGHKGISYGGLTPVLVKAIQEQQNQIEELKTKLTQLTVEQDPNTGKIIQQSQQQTDIKTQLLSLGLVVNENGVLEVRKVKTDELCVGSVCVNEEQLKELLEKAGISTTQNSNLKTQSPACRTDRHNSKVKTEEPNENQDLDSSLNASENSNPEDTTDTIDTTEESCIPNWQCSDWQPLPDTICLGETFVQTRECVDLNECGVETEKPEEEREMTGEKDCSETTSTTTPETVVPTTTTSATTIPTTTTSATTTPTTTSEN